MRGRGWLLAAVLAAGLVAGLMIAGRGAPAGGSSVARGASGWMAARLYLEARGTPTELLRRPLQEAPWLEGAPSPADRRTLVLAFPWQSRGGDLDTTAVLAHLNRGGGLLVGTSGEVVPSPAEVRLLEAIGAEPEEVGPGAMSPLRWRAEARRPLRLRPADRWRDAPDAPAGIELRRHRWLAEPPPGSELLVEASGRAVVAAWRHGRGTVVAMPAETLSNGRLGAAGHGGLLETLRGLLPGTWTFDEYHHGLVEPTAELPSATRLGFDLMLAQLGLVYLVAVLALVRRLGPAWRERPPLLGSAATFLLRLGTLHHRLGHHRAGAELLLRRAAELDRRFAPDAELVALAGRGDAAALVEVGRRVARRQRARSLG